MVVVFHERAYPWLGLSSLVEIFDSELGEWSSMTFRGSITTDGMLSNWANLNGVSYMAVGPSCPPTKLWILWVSSSQAINLRVSWPSMS